MFSDYQAQLTTATQVLALGEQRLEMARSLLRDATAQRLTVELEAELIAAQDELGAAIHQLRATLGADGIEVLPDSNSPAEQLRPSAQSGPV